MDGIENSLYKTLIFGKFVQLSALSVGGSNFTSDADDPCFRDGKNRLTIPGTTLAGALVETLMRLYPKFGKTNELGETQGNFISSKNREGMNQKKWGIRENEELLKSAISFRNMHLPNGQQTEWRQGVGIRQATGGTAKNKRALFDLEVVPSGAKWDFFLEIDTNKKYGPEAESFVIMALDDWRKGRIFLGRNPARGTGWVNVEEIKMLRLPSAENIIKTWPDNSRSESEILEDLKGKGAKETNFSDKSAQEKMVLEADHCLRAKGWTRNSWCYLTLDVGLEIGFKQNEYGLNPLQVGGHAALDMISEIPNLLSPPSFFGSSEVEERKWDENPDLDKPFTLSRLDSKKKLMPIVPGSSIRGAFRHTTSRFERMKNKRDGTLQFDSTKDADRCKSWGVVDPNVKSDFLEKAVQSCFENMPEEKRPKIIRERDLRENCENIEFDRVVQTFGFEKLTSRILFCDAGTSEESSFLMVKQEQHAEDEFTCGVYGSGKFNSNILIKGKMNFQILVEAPNFDELKETISLITPSFELAELGFLPIGGGKLKGCGWLPWKFDKIHLEKENGRELICPENEKKENISLRLKKIISTMPPKGA
ncbi:MAG: hypothetical protein HQM08_28810 [Candidatus Riflebacteria bacterium]|nr:hypothetical protein [Candidatus Riflebacteria bacterium]